MKKFVVSVLVSLISTSAFAGGGTVGSDHFNLAKQLAALQGKEGRLTETYDRSAQVGGYCTVSMRSAGDGTGYSIRLEVPSMYFTPVAHVIYKSAEFVDGTTLMVSDSSNRAGGDACGDFGGAINYKKGLIVENKTVTIRETFRCALEGLKKYDLVTTCQF